MSELTINDYHMILALQSDPLMSIRDLSRKVNLSWPTVKKRYDDIIERGIVRSPRARTVTEYIGLQRVIVIAVIPDFSALGYVEKACTLHPYTKYRARMIGDTIGLFMQFDIPLGSKSEKNLEEFFILLSERKLIDQFSIISSARIRYEVFPDLTKFDLDRYIWDYSWDEWFKYFDNPQGAELPLPNNYNEDFSEFTETRLNILAALSEDASIKQADLSDLFDLSRTEASRQYNFVMENYVQNIRLNYDRDAFDLSETFIFLLSDVSLRDQAILFSNIRDNPPPFRFSIDILQNNQVLLWGNMSLNQSNTFIFLLWKYYTNMKVWRLSTNDGGAMQYYFYPPNFDFGKRRWHVSWNYMVKDPIEELDLMMEETE